MRGPEGEAVFCGGCTFAGNFVGPVSEASFATVARSGPLSSETHLIATDQDGCQTEGVKLNDRGTSFELDDDGKADMVHRVALCTGATAVNTHSYGRYPAAGSARYYCRAVNQQSLNRVINNSKNRRSGEQ